MSPEACNLMRGNQLIEDALFGPNAPDTWPPGAGKADCADKKNFEDTQNTNGSGSNATSEAPSGERAKRDNPGRDDDHGSSVTIDRQRADAGTSTATLDSATQTVAPSAAPAHFCTCAGFRIASDCPKHAR